MAKPMRISELARRLDNTELKLRILLSLNLATVAAIAAMLLGYL